MVWKKGSLTDTDSGATEAVIKNHTEETCNEKQNIKDKHNEQTTEGLRFIDLL